MANAGDGAQVRRREAPWHGEHRGCWQVNCTGSLRPGPPPSIQHPGRGYGRSYAIGPLHLVIVDLFFRVAVLVIIVQVIEKLGEQRHPEWVIGEGGTVGQPGSDGGLSTAERYSAQAEG